jgi:hypothetical protein
MVCRGCGAPDDQGCWTGCPLIRTEHRQMTSREDYFVFTDEHGDSYKLWPTGTPGNPLRIVPLARRVQ